MEIVFFHRNDAMGYSIRKGFAPLIEGLRNKHEVKEFMLPFYGSNPIKLAKNIIFIYKHRSKYGINHITGEVHYGVIGLIGVTSIVTIHDDYAIRLAKRGFLDKLYKWLLWIYLPVKLADKVICISEQTLHNINRYIKNRNIIVLPHHVLPSNMVYSPKKFKESPLNILQIGTNENKNVETTIRALKGLNYRLTIVQKMTEAQTELATKLEINFENIYNLTDDEIVEQYKKADVVLFPSSYEGFGMIILESQAVGRPVITTYKEPMLWVAGKGGALFINDPKNDIELRSAILEVFKNETLQNELITRGQENIKRFTLEAVLDRYEILYRKLLKTQ